MNKNINRTNNINSFNSSSNKYKQNELIALSKKNNFLSNISSQNKIYKIQTLPPPPPNKSKLLPNKNINKDLPPPTYKQTKKDSYKDAKNKAKSIFIRKKKINLNRRNLLDNYKNHKGKKFEISPTYSLFIDSLKKVYNKKEILNKSNNLIIEEYKDNKNIGITKIMIYYYAKNKVNNKYSFNNIYNSSGKNRLYGNFIDTEIKDNKNKSVIKDIYYNKMKGFYNTGSTCYLNSFLQILIHIPGLIELLKDYKNEINENYLLFYLLNVADYPTSENLYYLKRNFNKLNSIGRYYGQDDSQEFGAEFLKIINNELFKLNKFISQWDYKDEFKLNKNLNIESKYKNDKIKKLSYLLNDDECEIKFGTIISEIFYYIECILIFNNNKLLLIDYFGEVDNQLSFYMKDGNALMNISVFDMLKNKYLKTNNKLIKLPKILMITLLRAINNEPLIETIVQIDKEIDLKEFIDTDFGKYSKPTKYSLYALNICIGNNKRFGHYYAYILINNEWYKFDDSYVTKVDKKQIDKDLAYVYGIYYINEEYLKSFMIQ